MKYVCRPFRQVQSSNNIKSYQTKRNKCPFSNLTRPELTSPNKVKWVMNMRENLLRIWNVVQKDVAHGHMGDSPYGHAAPIAKLGCSAMKRGLDGIPHG